MFVGGCNIDVTPSDTFTTGTETGGTGIPDENSPACAPFEEDEGTGGEEFPPQGESAFLYTCEGDVQVDIFGMLCISTQAGSCDVGELEIIPLGETPEAEFAVEVPSPVVTSTSDTYPAVEIGACCIPESEILEEGLDTVCAADCGARACRAFADEFAAIRDDPACQDDDAFDVDACRINLPLLCGNANLCQVRIQPRTRQDFDYFISELNKPEVLEDCQNLVRSEDGWQPMVAAQTLGWPLSLGAFTDLTVKADCSDIEPAPLESPEPQSCDSNPNANVGEGLSGEDFGGPLADGLLSFDTPFGNVSTSIIESSIAFRRLPCDGGSCSFSLLAADVDMLDFQLGPFAITDMHAELAQPASGALRGDDSAVIEAGLMRMRVSFTIQRGNKQLVVENPPIVAVNNEPVTFTIGDDNSIEILNASFGFPMHISAHMTTDPTPCTPMEP